ncbi:DNA helicase [Aeromonas phage AerS_266]|nr:DNA helicase [Aeromonas phage AerS_266]
MKNFFTFSPSVEEVGSFYVVAGINVLAMEADLKTNFGTSVIFSKLVTKLTSRTFKIHRFFMVEFAWILDHLTTQKDKRTVNRYRVGMLKYRQLYDEIKEKTWIKTTFEKHPKYDLDKALQEFAISPFADQREFLEDYSRIKYGYQLKGCLLDAVVGSGKSPTSLMWSKMISPYKTFIITPRNLITTPWLLEINKAFKTKKKIWTSIDGTDILDHLDADFFIIHKEQLRDNNWGHAIKAVTKSGKEPAKVIVDESHNYAEHNSLQSKGIVEFGTNKFISDILFMSGTPIKAQGKETYSLFATIDKFFDEKVRTAFLKLYGRDNTYLNEMLAHRLGRIKFTIPAITEMNNPPEPVVIKVKFPGVEKFTLNSIRLDMVAFINDRVKFYREHMPQYITDWEDVVKLYRSIISRDPIALHELDQYVKIVHHFRTHGYNNFTDSDKSKFAGQVEKQIESHLKGADLKYFRHIKSAVKYVGLKIRGEALGNVLGKARMDAVKETIRHADLPTLVNGVKKKTLVYTSYVEVIKELENHFELNGMKPIVVYGDNSKEIDQVVETFANDKDVNPLITTFATLREGKPMIMANQIILMNSPFRSFELKQTIARIYRRGQDEECFVYLIDLDTGSEENITSRSIDIMQWSAEQVDQLLGGGTFPGQSFQDIGPLDVSGFESREYAWDIAKLDPNLDISLEFADRSVPVFKRQYITDIF